MRLERIEAAGFFHFTQPFRLDCRALPTGLIAIVGANGAGKTGLALDAAIAGIHGPGRPKAFPSRDGKLADYATSSEAHIESLWHINGRGLLCSRVNVDGVRRKTDAVLLEVGHDGAPRPLNNGLVETYREVIAERFPTLTSLLASAYAAQNRRGGFGDLSQAERIGLFRELADLEHLEEKALTAKRCQTIADAVADQLRVMLEALRRTATPVIEQEIDTRLASLRDELVRCGTERVDLTTRMADLQTRRDGLAEAAQANAVAVTQVAILSDAVTSAAAALIAAQNDVASIPVTHRSVLHDIEVQYVAACNGIVLRRDALIQRYRVSVTDRDHRIANNRAVLQNAVAIRAAVATKADAEQQMSTVRLAQGEAVRERDEAREHVQRHRQQLSALQRHADALASARTRSALIGTVKFGELCATDPVCPLVVDAASARDSIPGLEAKLQGAPALEADLAHWQTKVETFDERARTLATRLRDLDQLALDAAPLAAQAHSLDHAEEKIREYEADAAHAASEHQESLDACIAEQKSAETAKARHILDAEEKRAETTRVALGRVSTLRSAVDAAQQRRTAAQEAVNATSGAKAALAAADGELQAAHLSRTALAAKIAGLDTEVALLTTQLSAVRAQLAEADDVTKRLRIAEDEGLAWATLARACGRDGIQRLEIDAAGPIVSDLANQLLQVGYGTRFTVQVVTQVATASGKDLKEKFTIEVLDNEHRAEVRDVGDLSGGERVIVEEAIRAALSCYVNLRSQQPSETIWRDETTGALDPENAPKYVAMLRKLQQISRAHQVLFITHSPECAMLADAQVHVHEGQATIALPPFTDNLREAIRQTRARVSVP